MFKNVFFKPIKEKVELPEEVINKVEEVEKVLEPVEDAPVVEEPVVKPMEEVPAVEHVEEVKEVVEEAKDDLTGGVATLSEPDEDGFQTLLAPEGYEGEEVFEEKEVEEPVAAEPEIVDQVNVIEEEQPVAEPITEAAQAEYVEEEIQAVLGENKEAEITIPEEIADKIHKIIEDNTRDTVKKILELVIEVVKGN